MKYYIGRINTWGPANAKCAKLHQEMKQYEHCLVADELSRDALVEQVRQTVEQANADYPRTKRLVVEACYNGVYCRPEKPASDSDNVFSFTLDPVRQEFHFTEKYVDGMLTIGGERREWNELKKLKKTE